MSDVHTVARRAREAVDARLVAAYHTRATEDLLEEGLHRWQDTRGRNFAVAIAQPLQERLPALLAALGRMSDGLHTFSRSGEEAERLERRVRMDAEPTLERCDQCQEAVTDAQHAASEAGEHAAAALSTAQAVVAGVRSLGSPPI